MNKKYVLFDLDGTLTDSSEGIIKSVLYALNHFGIEEKDEKVLKSFIGPPLVSHLMETYNFDEEKALEVLKKYRERYKTKGVYENKLYDGVEETLKSLKESSKVIAVATSKPRVFAKIIIEEFKLDKYFDLISGSELDGSVSKKIEVIKDVIDKLEIEDLSEIIMIGDRKYDILASKKLGIDSIGVLYGFGDKEELEASGADFLVEDIADILDIMGVLKIKKNFTNYDQNF